MLYIFIASIIIIIIYVFFYPKVVGWFGEHWTKQALKKLPKDYIVLNNILIKTGSTTHQIDHIIVSKYGIFVIETKQYNGYITGSKYDEKWVRHIGKGKIYYPNPIRQNYGHIKALNSVLNIDEKDMFNIVCIPSTAKLRIKHDGEVTRNYDIVKTIKSHDKEILPSYKEVVKLINDNNISNRKNNKKHIQDIKSNMCPVCGSQLVERKGKYGTFLGCSSYPKCKYTRNNK